MPRSDDGDRRAGRAPVLHQDPGACPFLGNGTCSGMLAGYVRAAWRSSGGWRHRKEPAGASLLERFPKRLSRKIGDSHTCANMIQASCWEEASMDGEALLCRLACAYNPGD
jgi:hypothetical protein